MQYLIVDLFRIFSFDSRICAIVPTRFLVAYVCGWDAL